MFYTILGVALFIALVCGVWVTLRADKRCDD